MNMVLDALYLNAFTRKQRLQQFYTGRLHKVFHAFTRVLKLRKTAKNF